FGANHGADIATVEHGPWWLCREVVLKGEQRRPNLWNRRDDRRRLADPMAFQRRLLECCRIEVLRGHDCCIFVARRLARCEYGACDGAIDQPRIEMAQSVMRGEALAECAFA